MALVSTIWPLGHPGSDAEHVLLSVRKTPEVSHAEHRLVMEEEHVVQCASGLPENQIKTKSNEIKQIKSNQIKSNRNQIKTK